MDKFSKKTLLSMIGGAGVYGAPSANQTVKFQFATSIATAAASQTAGALTFAADSNGNAAIYAQGTLVSSKIQNVAAAAASGAKHGGKTVTVTYIGDAGSIQTATFDVIDEAALEAYFSGSKTITLDTSNGRNIYEVITDGTTILVDNTNGLKSGLNIAYIPESGTTGATIALRDKNNTVLSSIEVGDIVGDGVLVDSIYHDNTGILELRFGNGKEYDSDDPTTYTKAEVDLKKVIDWNDFLIGAQSEDYLEITPSVDSSVISLNTKMQDPSTASANATGLADAWEVKQYVDSKSQDLSVEAESRDTYLDASVLSSNNKKVWVAAQVADLTVGKVGDNDTTISGTSGKLVDAADAATKTASFVNTRIAEEIGKLGNTEDSSAQFIKVEVTTENGDVNNVTLTEKVGSITGSASDLTGVAGLIDGAATATAVKTFVNGRLDASIQALDADITSDDNTYVTVEVKEVDGKIDDVIVTQTKSTITASASALSATAGIADGQEFATGVKTYVDGRLDASIQALDASIKSDTTSHDISIYLEEVDGVVTTVGVEHTAATVTYTAATDQAVANLTGSGSFVMGSDIAAIKNYIDAVSGALDSSVSDSDASNFVTVYVEQENGALKKDEVTVKYATVTAAPGDITVTDNGIVRGDVLEAAIEGALTWTVL